MKSKGKSASRRSRAQTKRPPKIPGPAKLQTQAETQPSNVEGLFEPVVNAVLGDPRIGQSKMFGGRGLTIAGRVFAVLYKGRLVVKLPKERVAALVRAGEADYFDPGHGRVSKGWAAVKPEAGRRWIGLAEEARDFVASSSE